MEASPQQRGQTRALTAQRFWLGALVLLVLSLIVVMTVAFVTRPLPRERVPSSVAEVRDELRALHEGGETCVRWADPRPLSDDEFARFANDLRGALALDLHTVLPLLSAVRTRNFEAARTHHRRAPDEELLEAIQAKLSPMDRLRFNLRSSKAEDFLPVLQGLRDKDQELDLDAGRVQLFEAYLGDKTSHARDVVERWRHRLASDAAQQSLVHRVAQRNTERRMEQIQVGLIEYRERFGSYPPNLARLVEHMKMTDQLPTQLRRGVERDGAVRDGWLRHFEYYKIGTVGYRLTSEGPSSETNIDDLILSDVDGMPGGRLPGTRQGETSAPPE